MVSQAAAGSVAKVQRVAVDDLAARLKQWLNARIPELSNARVSGLRSSASGGLSGEVFIVDLDGAAYPTVVVKKNVREQTTNPQANFSTLVRLQSALCRIPGLPVPRVLGVESQDDAIGAPFIVMEFVAGDIPSDVPSYAAAGWVCEASSRQRASMWRSGLSFLVKLHRVDASAAGLGSLFIDAPGADHIERCINHAVSLFRDEAGGRISATCESAIDWLHRHRPPMPRECINWGDARIGNMIWRDFQCVAVIDWEMGHMGCPGIDLGWWSFFHRWSTHGQGLPALEGMVVGRPLADLYERCGGDRIEHFRFYEILASIRGLSIWLRTFKAMKTQGAFSDLDPLGNDIHMIRVLKLLLEDAENL